MKAMILAAGLGTRLKPHTNYRPKALVKINGVPLLEICIRRMIAHGFDEIIVNVHHFGEQIIRFLKQKKNFGIRIEISDEQDQLLDTGGGLKKAATFFDDGQPFLLCNTDVVTNINLRKFYDAHQSSDAIATLAVRHRKSSRYFVFNDGGLLCGWTNVNNWQLKMSRAVKGDLSLLAFSGMHIIDPKVFAMMPEQKTFSIIDLYLEIAATQNILAFVHDEDVWLDAGKSADIEEAGRLVKQHHLSW